MSAELLRQAADRLDALADAATRGPGEWRAVGAEDEWVIENELVAVADVFTAGDAAYIAAMSPEVGKTLAAWLRVEVGRVERNNAPDYDWTGHPALAVARAILGEES